MTRQQLQMMLDEIALGSANPNSPMPQQPPATAAATTPAPVSGGDYADIFAQQLQNQATQAAARQRLAESVTGFDAVGYANKMSTTPELRRGTQFDPFAPGGLLDNPTHRAAQAIQASPLWQMGPGGRLIHGTNYPTGPGTVGLPPTGGIPSDTLPPMGPEERAATELKYAPPPLDVFAERGLPTTAETNPNDLLKRRQPYVPPPPPPNYANY